MLSLRGEKTYLVEFTESYLAKPEYFAWLRDLDVVTGIHRLDYLMPLDEREIRDYVLSLLRSKADCFFALHEASSERFIGTVKLGHIDWRTGTGDVGILIGERSAQGKGYSKDAVRTLSRYAFDRLSLRKLTAGTASNNLPMMKCFTSLGYKEEGRLREKLLVGGRYVDHVLYGLFKPELAS